MLHRSLFVVFTLFALLSGLFVHGTNRGVVLAREAAPREPEELHTVALQAVGGNGAANEAAPRPSPTAVPMGIPAPTPGSLTGSITTVTPPDPQSLPATREDPSARGGARLPVPSPLGQQAAELALTFVGLPYAWAGASPETGFDCSGLVYYVYRRFGVTLDRDSFSQFTNGTPVARGELQPGDLVFFEAYAYGASHVGIYIGNGRFVHSVDENSGVRITGMSDGYWGVNYLGARRIF